MPVGPRRGRLGYRVQSTTYATVPTALILENTPNMACVLNMTIATKFLSANTATAAIPVATRSSIVQTNQNPVLDDNTQNLVLIAITTKFHIIMDTMLQRLDAQAEALAALRFQSTFPSIMPPPIPQTPSFIPSSIRSMARKIPQQHTSSESESLCASTNNHRSHVLPKLRI